MNRMSVIAALVAIPCLALQAGCSLPGQSAQPHRARPVLLAEAQGICPLHQIDVQSPLACRFSRVGNGATMSFDSPRRLWGVAYAFNCGSRAQNFAFVERLPGMDHMGLPAIVRHGKQGSGYTMISKQQMMTLLNAVPHNFEFDGAYTEVDVNSSCTWHVKAILGSRQDVISAIPSVPRMQRRWWLQAGSTSS